jgi:hypothetical protein
VSHPGAGTRAVRRPILTPGQPGAVTARIRRFRHE